MLLLRIRVLGAPVEDLIQKSHFASICSSWSLKLDTKDAANLRSQEMPIPHAFLSSKHRFQRLLYTGIALKDGLAWRPCHVLRTKPLQTISHQRLKQTQEHVPNLASGRNRVPNRVRNSLHFTEAPRNRFLNLTKARKRIPQLDSQRDRHQKRRQHHHHPVHKDRPHQVHQVYPHLLKLLPVPARYSTMPHHA